MGMRLLARGPGLTCLGLNGYNKITWLRVVVVDSAGMARYDGKPVDPKLLNCRLPAVDRGVAQPTERTALPASALADSDIAAGARKAFAFELCVAREQVKGDTGGMYEVRPALDRCADSVAAVAPGWTLGRRSGQGGATYSATFEHVLSPEGGETRDLEISSSEGTVYTREFRKGPPFVYGMRARIQGDEYTALRVAASCAKLYHSRAGKPAPSIDTLIAFARSVWLESTPGDRPSHACKADGLRFRPRLSGEASDSRVHESGVFTLRYSPRAGMLVVRPLRWGETGVVSYRSDPTRGMMRTFENREPAPGDEYLHPRLGYWVLPRSSDAKQ
jgi:hypothetical protein